MDPLPLVDVREEGDEAEAAGLAVAAEEDALALLRAADLLSELSLTLCDAPFIQNLNVEWRGVDAPTDVLSFPMEDEIMLGDLVICVEVTVCLRRKQHGRRIRNSFMHPPVTVWAG